MNENGFLVAPPSVIDQFGRRTLDVVVSLALLIVLAPLLLALTFLVYSSDRGPILFGHRRLGKDGKTFRCFKFRSMVVDAEKRLADLLANNAEARREWELDHKLRTDPRITSIGNFLRRSSLDELPQLFNVLRGEMSLVGPRPIVEAEKVRYGRYFGRYCMVRPGITGLWQVSGRNDVSYRRRVAMDVAYVRNQTLGFNISIMARTIPSVLLSRGSY
ncbi:sugar transferase [Sphingomonas nostoxanthinifaciens]|nr:sugar transferase [Sphingomonas nostoxanthinifaciens]